MFFKNKFGHFLTINWRIHGSFSDKDLALMCEGLSTGIVLDSGDGVSHVIPVVEGYIQKHAVTRLNLAGRHVTNYLVRLLMQSGYAFNSSADFETVRDIKEQLCFVSYDV